MKLLTAIATIAVILTPQSAQASDAHLKACTGTQLAMLSANIQTYERFMTNIDKCKEAALDRINKGIKDTDNPEALKEAQALQAEMEALAKSRETGEVESSPTTNEGSSEVLIPGPEASVVTEEPAEVTLEECLAVIDTIKASTDDKKVYAEMCESNEGTRTATTNFLQSKGQ